MIPVNDQNYDVDYALTANIHVMILVIDRNYDIHDVLTGNHAKSLELYRNSGHSPELQHRILIYIVIPVIHRNYNVYHAGTANIHILIPVK